MTRAPFLDRWDPSVKTDSQRAQGEGGHFVDVVPVIDVFAGPGGLTEGFCSFSSDSSRRPFDVRLSIRPQYPETSCDN